MCEKGGASHQLEWVATCFTESYEIRKEAQPWKSQTAMELFDKTFGEEQTSMLRSGDLLRITGEEQMD